MSSADDMFGKAVDLLNAAQLLRGHIKIVRRSCVPFTPESTLRMQSATSKTTPTWALSIGPRQIISAGSTSRWRNRLNRCVGS
ncbi:MAG: hypothetical protein U9R47_10550 [Actinomycetota bacterium]|nr:hypothetical protein [Actinomycetota bacterium]